MKSRAIRAGVVALGVLALAAAWMTGSTAPSSQARAFIEKLGLAGESLLLPSAKYVAGTSTQYGIELETALLDAGGGVLGGLQLRGELIIGCLRSSPSETALQGTFQGTIEGVAGHEVPTSLERGFALPFFWTLDPNGRVLQIRTKAGTPQLVESTWKALLAALQYPLSDTLEGREREEEDATGVYLARFVREDEAVIKTKTATGEEGGVQRTFEEARGRFVISPAGELKSFDGLETISATIEAPKPVTVRTRFRTALDFRDTVPWDATAALASFEAASATTMRSGASLASRQSDLDDARVGRFVVGDILARLARLESTDPEDKWSRAQAFSVAVSLVRRDVKALELVVERLDETPEQRKTWMAVLRDAGTPDAQNALRRFADRSDERSSDRLAALRNLSLVQEPTRDTAAALRAKMDDPELAYQGRLGVGTVAHRIRERLPDLARELDDLLTQRLGAAGTEEEILQFLAAVGNAGAISALPQVQRYLRHENVSIRTKAVDALRFMPGAEVDALLAAALLKDADARVRAVAAEAMRFRLSSPALIASLQQGLQQDKDVAVRHAALNTTAVFYGASAELESVLRWVAQNDPHPDLRTRAANILRAKG